MQKFDAVLFDLDGTLIDSAPGILATFQKTFEAFGLTVGEQRLRPFLGPPLRSSMAQLLPQAQVEQAVETYRELYQTHGLDGCAPYAGVPQMLQASISTSTSFGLLTSGTGRFSKPHLPMS